MPKIRLSWPIAFALAVPAAALTGCPGLLGTQPTASPGATTSPTPASTPTSGPTASPTPPAAPSKRTSGLVLADIEFFSSGHHTFKIRNIGTSDVDISGYALCYQAPNVDNLLYVRLNEQRTGALVKIAANTSISISANATGSSTATTWFTAKDAGIGASDTLGIQSSGGGLSLYKDISGPAGFADKTKMVDYVQWGNAPSEPYARESVAVAAGLWAQGTYAPAGSPGKELELETPGATGSANWELVDQD